MSAELLQKLSDQLDDMSKLIDERDEQIKTQGAALESLGKKMDESDARIVELKEEIEAERKRADEIELKFGRPGASIGDEYKSPGQMFVDSDNYKDMVEKGDVKCSPVDIKSIMSRKNAMMAIMAAAPDRAKTLTSDPLSAGALVDPMRVAEIITPPERAFRVRDLLTVDTTMSNAIEYVEETGFSNLYTVLTAAAAGSQPDIEVESVAGLYPGQTINIGGEERIIDAGGIDPATRIVTVTVNLTAPKSIGDPVTSQVFAPTEEATAKPQMGLTYELKSVPVKTIAHWIPASRQILADAGQLRGQIDGRLIYGLGLTEEEQLLYGDGAGQNILGILTNPAVQTYLWSNGPVGDTQIDAIRRAMTLARVAEYPITGVVVNPVDWEDIELLKGSDKHYIWLKVDDGTGQRMFRVPVVDTTAIRVAEFATGAFSLGATVYDREQATIRVSDSHGTYFVENMLAILAEQREALANFRPEAFVYGKFDSAPS
jgi:hypothetical protein